MTRRISDSLVGEVDGGDGGSGDGTPESQIGTSPTTLKIINRRRQHSSTGTGESETEAHNRILGRQCVCLVVLGDLGRSPRILYHALSLAKEGYFVQLLGYGGPDSSSTLPESISTHPSIWHKMMREPPGALQKLPRVMAYPLKVAWQAWFLFWAFFWMTLCYQFYPDYILLQNPPAIPTLGLCWFFSLLYRCPLIIDWHNYGFSLMSLTLGPSSRIVRWATRFENYFGSKGDYHLCVTKAMKDDLKRRLGIDAVTLYDRPPEQFRPLSKEERLTFLKKFSIKYPRVLEGIDEKGESERPGILVSSTSWTEDEDFGVLLSALKDYEGVKTDSPGLYPKLLVFITGKGPMKEYYRSIIDTLYFQHVEIHLPWLEFEDYPKLLACADLGVSLHTSSSGLDLPMKVVDMFGCGLPVCAKSFNCVSELVVHNENSLVFNTSDELGRQIQDWFRIPWKANKDHERFRKNLIQFQSLRWHENWVLNVEPLLRKE